MRTLYNHNITENPRQRSMWISLDRGIISKMDWVKFFTREEPVAGLEITNDYLRLTLLSQGGNRKDDKSAIVALAEKSLKEGVISDGLLIDKEEFAKAIKVIKSLLDKTRTKIRYVVISIPENKIFSRVFAFPKSIKDEKLKETMELNIGFQLPIKLGDVYLDWEKIEDLSKNEVLLAAIQKTVINDYVSALEPTGLKIIAAEFHLLSIARSMPPSVKPVMTVIVREQNMTVGVVKNKVLRFMHTISSDNLPKANFTKELKRIIDFYEGEYEPLSKTIVLNKETASSLEDLANLDIEVASIIEPFSSHHNIETNPGKWLVSAGAAIRGSLPRVEDTLISLLPVGTEEAYEYQKAITFSKFIADVVAITSIIFLSVFVGAWFLMLMVQESLANEYSFSSSLPIPREAIELEKKAIHLNSILEETNKIVKTTPLWSDVITEIKTRAVPGVLTTNLVVNLPNMPINLQGVARDRNAINLLKRTFEASNMFTEVDIPFTHLEKKTDIPFSMSFKLRDAESIYLK